MSARGCREVQCHAYFPSSDARCHCTPAETCLGPYDAIMHIGVHRRQAVVSKLLRPRGSAAVTTHHAATPLRIRCMRAGRVSATELTGSGNVVHPAAHSGSLDSVAPVAARSPGCVGAAGQLSCSSLLHACSRWMHMAPRPTASSFLCDIMSKRPHARRWNIGTPALDRVSRVKQPTPEPAAGKCFRLHARRRQWKRVK